ncbi:MAG: dephospho-CoA kinase [Chloroflexi bacterium]|nr:dephospho-CoA kinase [Chloroflexota bacterium]
MSKAFPDKYIIGLTGNIATGKSVVRKMLEHLGAYGIDADRLAHRAIARGAPGYTKVVETFGKWILGPDGEIDRRKLGKLVFCVPEAMEKLEQIVHPLVLQAVKHLIRRAPHKVVVIEAIKLLETDLHKWCDAIWVVDAPPEVQLERLIKRGLSPEEARQRIQAQSAQAIKKARADVVIDNSRSFEYTWRQVMRAWTRIPGMRAEPAPTAKKPATRPTQASAAAAAAAPQAKAAPAAKPTEAPPMATVKVEKATPSHAKDIAAFIARVTRGRLQPSRADVIARFGDRAYLLVKADGQLVGLIGWQVENLVTRINELYILPGNHVDAALHAAMNEIIERSKELQSEAALAFVHPTFYKATKHVWEQLGFEPKEVKDLARFSRAWVEAAEESKPKGPSVMLFKRLRKDQVLQPL